MSKIFRRFDKASGQPTESPHSEGGRSFAVVNKGEENPDAFARNRLGELYDRGPILVLNDEAHHAYQPAPVGPNEKLTADERAEREEATVWISGLDKINAACGIKFCVDLSATPFYLFGSGYIEGSPFPWLVSDFGLVDAIESGIVKIPRIPVSDTTGRPEPKYFALWRHLVDQLQPGEKFPGGKPKPDIVWRKAQDALVTLAGQWKERYEDYRDRKPGEEQVPPVMIVVCDNTDIAELFYQNISGEQVRCVVSVQMLTEGWDANNVTHILGLRAFQSQLLCEQVVGRGLRRMDYTVDKDTGMLTEEYVDIYGVPFSVIPFKGRTPGGASEPSDKPKNHVMALDQRAAMEIRFPIVEGYVVALRQNLIKANIAQMEPLRIEPFQTPTAVFVKPQVGYQIGTPTLTGGFQFEEQNREAYYSSNHLQTIQFEIARLVVWALTNSTPLGTPKMRLRSRHQLFPQVYRLVNQYVSRRVDFCGCHPCELGLQTYVQRTVERLIAAIEPDDAKGEPPLLPIGANLR